MQCRECVPKLHEYDCNFESVVESTSVSEMLRARFEFDVERTSVSAILRARDERAHSQCHFFTS